MSFHFNKVYVSTSLASVSPVEVLQTIVETYVDGDGEDGDIPEQLPAPAMTMREIV